MAQRVWTLRTMDCMVGLRRMQAGTATAVITDPPWGISMLTKNPHRRDARNDRILNDDAPFIWWLREAFIVTNKNGCLACFCRADVQETWRVAIVAAGWRVRSQVIWDREIHGSGDCFKQFSPRHEVIWFATKGRFTFKHGRPDSVLRFRYVLPKDRKHPAEKPVALMRHLVRVLTIPGDLVVDPFAGSGATGVAAVQEGRRFEGFELDARHARIARRRIKRHSMAV